MKKSFFVILGLALVFMAVSCSKTEAKETEVKPETSTSLPHKKVIVDYSGNALGREIPKWVMLASEGNHDVKAYESVLPDLKDKKIFIAEGTGSDLNSLRKETDTIEISSQVATTIECVVGSTVAASTTKILTEIDNELETDPASFQYVRILGLEKSNDYWIQLADLDAEGNEIDRYYLYYTIWTMDKDLFQAHIDAKVKRILESTTEN